MHRIFLHYTCKSWLPVQPTWLQEPSDVTVPVGGTIEVPCRAAGFPDPHLTWERETG